MDVEMQRKDVQWKYSIRVFQNGLEKQQGEIPQGN